MSFLNANREVFSTIIHPYTWLAFAWEDLRDRYKRSIIGLLWIPLAFLMFVGIKVLVFSKLNAVGLEAFTIHVVVGYWIWQTLNGMIADSCNVFVASAGYIKSSPLPYATYVLQSVFRNSIPFFYNFLIVIGLCWIVTGHFNWNFLYAFPAALVFALNAIWLSFFLGPFTSRYRDILHLIQTIMRMMFFVTPIIWIPSQLGELGELLSLYNPFAHFINIVRDPVAGNGFPLISWSVVIFTTVIGWLLGMTVYAKTKSNIVHWV